MLPTNAPKMDTCKVIAKDFSSRWFVQDIEFLSTQQHLLHTTQQYPQILLDASAEQNTPYTIWSTHTTNTLNKIPEPFHILHKGTQSPRIYLLSTATTATTATTLKAIDASFLYCWNISILVRLFKIIIDKLTIVGGSLWYTRRTHGFPGNNWQSSSKSRQQENTGDKFEELHFNSEMNVWLWWYWPRKMDCQQIGDWMLK